MIAAVSGGRDSMALLHVLRSLEKPMELTIYAGHVNHCLRESSDDDAAFVERKSNDLGIPFLYAELDPNKKKKSKSPEEWAREERYKALQEILKSINGDCIATAHHANDQAETVLFRLQQKSGIDGLRGIHEKRGNIIRPFLPFKRRDIDIYIENHSISFIEDKTNRAGTSILNRPENSRFIPRRFLHCRRSSSPELSKCSLVNPKIHGGGINGMMCQNF